MFYYTEGGKMFLSFDWVFKLISMIKKYKLCKRETWHGDHKS